MQTFSKKKHCWKSISSKFLFFHERFTKWIFVAQNSTNFGKFNQESVFLLWYCAWKWHNNPLTLPFYSLDGMSAYIEELDLPEYHDDKRQPGGHWGSFVCHDFIKIWTGDEDDHDHGEMAEKLCGRWSAYDHEGHGTGALETVPTKAMVESCDEDTGCHSDIFISIEIDGGIKGMAFRNN